MIETDALVAYKNKPALVKEKAGDKIVIALLSGEKVKAREKDIDLIHPGQVKNFDGIIWDGSGGADARESWELMLAEEGRAFSLRELAELAFGAYTPASAWAAFLLALDGLYFSGGATGVFPKPREQVEAEEKKRADRLREENDRAAFVQRLKERRPILRAGEEDDRRFAQDIEALALGKSARSRSMKDAGLGESPQEAHALLLECSFWTVFDNPHPSRHGVSTLPARQAPPPPPDEARLDLSALRAFAIDSPWSHDPDDALSLEASGDGATLYVHVADPGASIGADSACEKEARDRGATLYAPEGSSRMLADEALPIFALGLCELSPALTFKIALDARGKIVDTEIFPSIIRVTRITYDRADELILGDSVDADAAILRALRDLGERNFARRLASGAVHIEMPETRIDVSDGKITVEPIERLVSAALVRECMLLAGEAAGLWAVQRGLALPFVAQETGDLPAERLEGMAGSFQLRKCMRPRALSSKPGLHSGLGLDIYTQVTSPLRRYTDLLSHIQIRAALKGEAVLGPDELAARMFAGEAAAAAVAQAERSSRAHWLMAYLGERKNSAWEAVALEKRGNRWVVAIPALALETQVGLRAHVEPNDVVRLALKSANVPLGEAIFSATE
ncbi:MAG: RNB domain-containing ribonuclease [Treponema sp.]|nr:RNB domain-containing ribonuclease [Treponema sp.]